MRRPKSVKDSMVTYVAVTMTFVVKKVWSENLIDRLSEKADDAGAINAYVLHTKTATKKELSDAKAG